MNIPPMLKELRCELESINRAIAALERWAPPQMNLRKTYTPGDLGEPVPHPNQA